MGKMSKRKGAVGEREAAAKLNDVLGTRFHRGRQYQGGPGSPDLAGDLPGLHVEVKRCERLSLYRAMAQARRDASVDQVPAVIHRANGRGWLLVVAVEDLIRLLDVVDACRGRLAAEPPDAVGSGQLAVRETGDGRQPRAEALGPGGERLRMARMGNCGRRWLRISRMARMGNCRLPTGDCKLDAAQSAAKEGSPDAVSQVQMAEADRAGGVPGRSLGADPMQPVQARRVERGYPTLQRRPAGAGGAAGGG